MTTLRAAKLWAEDSANQRDCHCVPESYQDAAHCAIFHPRVKDLPLKAVAAIIKVRPERLYRAADRLTDHLELQFRHVAPLTRTTGNYALVSQLTRDLHLAWFRLPDPDPTRLDLFAHTSEAVAEFGDTLASLRAALADARLTPAEARGVEQEGQEAIAAIAALIESVKMRAVA